MEVTNNDVIELVAEVLNIPVTDISSRSQRTDFAEWDALGHQRICMEVVDRFGPRMNIENMNDLTSIESLTYYILAA